MSICSEFREFAVKGNVIDLAVGVIIGAAFGKIVDSLVKDLIMPIVGRDLRRPRFLQLVHPAGAARRPATAGPMTYEALTKAGVPLFAYGNFITVVAQLRHPRVHDLPDGEADQPAEARPRRRPRGAARGRRAAARDSRRLAEIATVARVARLKSRLLV